MKKSRILKKKIPMILATGAILAGLGGGVYYLNNRESAKPIEQQTDSKAIPDSDVQKNVEEKGEANSGTTTTTPAVTAEKPAEASLGDVNLQVLRDGNEAVVYLLGPGGTYGVEKLVNGAWKVIVEKISRSSIGGGTPVDTIFSLDAETHYRIYLLDGSTKVATSGDTIIKWEQILNNGTLNVPIAR